MSDQNPPAPPPYPPQYPPQFPPQFPPQYPPPYPQQGYYPPPNPYAPPIPALPYAHWGLRVAATLLDGLLGVPFLIGFFGGFALIIGGMETQPDGTITTGDTVTAGQIAGFAVLGLSMLAMLGFSIWNQIFRQGRTGASLGKSWMKITVVSEQDGRPIGALMTFVRQLVHQLDGLACYVGYLWPLWDDKRQTFADKIMSTVVLQTESLPQPQQSR
jgi:uncharacterized RDD family membrane protein YckC